MPVAVFVVQGGKRRGIRPDPVDVPFRMGIVCAVDGHGPAEFDVREPLRQTFNPRTVYIRGVHIQFFQVRKSRNEIFQHLILVVPVPEGQLVKVHIL